MFMKKTKTLCWGNGNPQMLRCSQNVAVKKDKMWLRKNRYKQIVQRNNFKK